MLTLYLTLGHETLGLQNMDLFTVVYILYAALGFRAQILSNVSLQVQKALDVILPYFSNVPSMLLHCPE